MSNIIIYGGGTFSHIRNHLSLCAMSFGTTAKWLKNHLPQATLRLTKMADSTSNLVTNDDVLGDLEIYLADPHTSTIIMSAALCDYEGQIGNVKSGSHAERLQTRKGPALLNLLPAPKVIDFIKALRPDIKIIGFKTTTDKPLYIQLEQANRMDVSVVLANDTVSRSNVLVTQGGSYICSNRADLLQRVVDELNQAVIKYVSNTEMWVQLDKNRYISKDAAYKKAVYLAGRYNNLTPIGWHTQVEGLFMLRKKEIS